MPTISSASSLYAPAVAEANGRLVAAWVDTKSAQIMLVVFDLVKLTFSPIVPLMACFSTYRPTLAFWNGTFYEVHGGTEKAAFFVYQTDLAYFPNAQPLGSYSSATSPRAFPFASRLIVTQNGLSTKQVSYFTLDADWLTNGQRSLASEPTKNVALPQAVTQGAAIAVCPTAVGVLWCVVYAQANAAMFSYSCFDEAWTRGASSAQLPGASPLSPPALTVYGGRFYAVWVDSSSNTAKYSVGVPSAAGSITWSTPVTIDKDTDGATDVSITTGADGMFVGYRLPATPNGGGSGQLGVVKFIPRMQSVEE